MGASARRCERREEVVVSVGDEELAGRCERGTEDNAKTRA